MVQRLLDYVVGLRRKLLYPGIILAVVGALLLVINFRHNSRYAWKPVKQPFRIQAGTLLESSFIAELDQKYEIEIEFQRNIADQKFKKFVMDVKNPSPLDIEWKVLHNGKIHGRGTSRDYLYITKTGDPLLRRILRKIMNIPYYQDIEAEDSVTRGIGRFPCEAGQRYDIEAKVGTTITELDATNPIFGVRINRIFAIRHFRSMIPMAATGFLIFGISMLTLSGWLLGTLYSKFRSCYPVHAEISQ